MPFPKRAVEPQLLCRYQVPNTEGVLFQELACVSNLALSRSLRQLSDLAKHACSMFQELESELSASCVRLRGLQRKVSRLQETCSGLDPKQEPVPVSDLDVESKLRNHYQAPWLQQRNVLRPSTRPPCVDELHRRANLGLWTLHRDEERNRSGSSGHHRVTISISELPPMPLTPPPNKHHDTTTTQLTTFDSARSSSPPTECCQFSPWSRKAGPSEPDADGAALGQRSKFPVPNTPTTLDKQTNWSKALPLPTPEERMKSNSQVINSSVVPINVSGLVFDRDASVRCSLVHSQSLLQRRRKLRRRRTVAGVPRQLQHDFDSDDSPGSRNRTVIVHTSLDITPSNEELTSHHSTRDSGCQTEDFLISGAPSRRRIRSQRILGGGLSLSYSAGNIPGLSERADAMFTASLPTRLRSRSLPRDPSQILDNGQTNSEEEELSTFHTEDFLPVSGKLLMRDEDESVDDQDTSVHQCGLKYEQLSDSPERSWMDRARSQLPRNTAEMGSCEISSSSDTFSSPVHSVSAAAVLGGQMDHKDDHQSSSGNWSGSSSTCPSQTSETIPPAASPPLTGSSHCDSELSLNAAINASDDPTVFPLDHYHQGVRIQRTGSFSSTAMDILEEAGTGTPVEQDWNYTNAEPSPPQDFSPEPNREVESSLGCPSFSSMATCESSFSDKPPSEKADTVSHYSVDTEGYYTSMHFDCGLNGSRSFTHNSFAASSSDLGLSDHLSLSRRCLSLKKPKSKPCPPQRSSSLRKICSEENIPDKKEPKISCGQQLPPLLKERKLRLSLSGSPGHQENLSSSREPLVVWGMHGSTDLPDLGVFSSSDSHSFKDEGVVQTDYADLWLLNDLKSSDPYRSLSNSSTATGTTVIECIRSQESSESQTSLSDSRATTPSLPSAEGDCKLTSPEKLAGLASPSSGYSSQSETPTSSFPLAFFPGPLSPAGGKRKPKVPERKSSLSSRSCRNNGSAAMAKKDLELPIIPPSHLDLSAFQGINKVYRTQFQVLHQNTPKTMPVTNSEVLNPAHIMSITPTVLHSVHLRPIGKEIEDQTVKCSTSHLQYASSDELCTSTFTSEEDVAYPGETRLEDTVSESITSYSPLSELAADVLEAAAAQEGFTSTETLETDCSSRSDRTEPCEEYDERTDVLQTELHTELHTEVPAADSPSEMTHVSGSSDEGDGKEDECESSGVSAESVCQEGNVEFLPETDKSSIKDSAPNESVESSPPSDESRPEDDAVFRSPTKTRSTEDLFAMIHRSKRKVLGRKDSAELAATNRLNAAAGSSPVISATSSPVSSASPSSIAISPAGSQRVCGSIYRNVKKSTTSNEEFKLLLLKKGSRSESGYRMSATEILKSPVTPKSAGDSLTESFSPLRMPEELGASPQQQSPGLDHFSFLPRSNTDGFSPKSFSASGNSRQGRSRIPPPANSSRYGARGRIYSAPMQAISEGETENSDGSPHDDHSSLGST